MSENLDNLEREVESMLAAWVDDLSVEPAEAAVFRVRAAVQHELNESWLTDHAESVPSPEAVERVRSAVHEELGRRLDTSPVKPVRASRPGRRFAWVRVAAGLAAAAVIAIGIGVVQRGRTLEEPSPTPDPAIEAELDVLLAAAEAEDVYADDPATASILSDIDAVEESIGRWESATAGDLQSIMSEIDEILAQPDAGENMSRFRTLPQGAIG